MTETEGFGGVGNDIANAAAGSRMGRLGKPEVSHELASSWLPAR